MTLWIVTVIIAVLGLALWIGNAVIQSYRDPWHEKVALIPGTEYLRMDAQHVTHLDKPGEFIRVIECFFAKH